MKISGIFKNEKGSILVAGLLILAVLTIIAIVASMTTSTDIKIARSEKLYKTALYAADSGIEVGREALNRLKVADAGGWDNLLQGNELKVRAAAGYGTVG